MLRSPSSTVRPLVGVFLAGVFAACADSEIGPATCPEGAVAIDGRCEKQCSARADCRIDQDCVDGVCAPPPPGRVRIRTLIAPASAVAGTSVDVGFAVDNASRIQIAVSDGSGAATPVLDSTERFAGIVSTPPLTEDVAITLAAFGAEGQPVTANRSVQVAGDDALRIAFFTADPPVVSPGQTTVLSWAVVNGEGTVRIATVEGEEVLARGALEGDVEVPVAETTTYVLEARGGGEQRTAETTAEVRSEGPADILQFVISPGPVDVGDGALVSWQTVRASRVVVRLNGRNGPILYESRDSRFVAEGALPVLPLALSRVYTLEAFGAGSDEPSSSSVTIGVNPAPAVGRIASYTVEPVLFAGDGRAEQVEFRWTVGPATAQLRFVIDGVDRMAGDAGYLETFVPQGTLVGDLTVEAPGGLDRQRLRVWDRRPEREPNDEAGGATPTGGFAIDGALLDRTLDEDWFAVEVSPGGQVRAEFLVPAGRLCPSGITIELLNRGNLLQSDRATPFGACPELFQRDLAAGTYHVRLSADLGAAVFDYVLAIAADPAQCGDGLWSRAVEACDDGNLAGGDGCSPDCQVEPAFDYRPATAEVAGYPAPPEDAERLGWLPYVEGQMFARGDEGFAVLPLPFTFSFFGREYQGLVVHTNGFVSLQTDLAGANIDPRRAWGDVRPNALVAAFLGDLVWDAGSGPLVWVETDPGTGEVVWVDFSDARHRGEDSTIGQVRLGVSSRGVAALRYGEISSAKAFFAGIEDHTGERQVSPCPSGTCGPDIGLRNTVTVFRNTVD